jgi:hypothetical protein
MGRRERRRTEDQVGAEKYEDRKSEKGREIERVREKE